jgi:hypothetical protein
MHGYIVHAYKGYFVGSFCVTRPDGLFVGVAHICTDRPDDSESARPVEQVRSIGAYDSAGKAVNAAQHQARAIIDSLTPHWDPFTVPGWVVSR